MRSRHSRRTLPTQRSACAFALGAAIGVRMTLTPSVRRKASKAFCELDVAVADQDLRTLPLGTVRHEQIPRLLRRPGPRWGGR
jgi:hypothetical protein